MRPPVVGLLRALLAVVLGGLLVRGLSSFAPGSAHVGLFDADMAIPVVMANGSSGHRLFDAYYFGQDRFGAWPYLLARLARGVLGFDWTASRLFWAHATAALLAGVPLALLSRRAGLVAAAACALVAVTNPSVFHSFLNLSQPYAWQVLAMCGAWAVLHSLLLTPERPGGRLVVLAVLSFLAVWMSPTSGPLLVLLLGVELLALRGPESWRERLWRAVPVGLMVAAGMAGERTLRWRYHRTVRRAFGTDFQTEVHLDVGHLLDNARALAAVWARDGWKLALGLTVVGVGACLVLRVRAWRGARAVQVPEGWEALTLASGAAAVALANFALCAAVNHVRNNLYHERYLTLSHLFLAMAAALVVLAGAQALLARTRASEVGGPLFALGLLGAAHLGMPAPAPLPEERVLEDTARALQPEHGQRILLGGYWHTYPYAALARPGSVVAVPVEWDYQRTRFDWARLRAADEVVVNHAELEAFGPADAPHALIGQLGVLLRLVRTASPREGFSLYARADREALPVKLEPSASEWNLCDVSARARVRFESTGPVTVLVRSMGVRPGARTPRALLAGRESPVEVLPDFYRVRVEAPVGKDIPLELGVGTGMAGDAPGCRVQDVFVLPGSTSATR
ncbi:hypothetical protein JRI60_03560 [Archangium violaceum]|uniref:hypothetical protein n=1 Tax=Archangium violaceum TaxID=83451 RepID=UPI001951CAC6|nr:hypothetical protein [Archangium violaceum]QRN98163.1 hypothetical protein JRI60_03560 [Archangium violaceum]